MTENTEQSQLLKRKRTTLRTSVTKLITKIESEIQKTEVTDESKIELCIEQLNDKFDSLKLVDSDLEKVLPYQELDKELESAEEYREKIITWRFKANKYLRNLNQNKNKAEHRDRDLPTANPNRENKDRNENENNQETPDPPNQTNNKVDVNKQTLNVKLPKITIPKFSGNINEWLTFWNSYESAVHSNNSLDDVSKFNYLKAHLSGTALETIEGFSISSENYFKAITLLEQRFGRKEILINTHMSQLLEISPLKRSNDVKAFRQLFDKIQIHIRSLESLGIESDTYSTLLSPVILKSLTNDLVFDFHKEFGEKYSLSDLIDFLNRQLIAKEKTGFCFQREDHYNSPVHSNWQKAKTRSENRNFTASGLFVYDKAPKCNKLCLFCDKLTHSTMNCIYGKNLPIEKRRLILIKKGSCFRCLKAGHLSSSCKSKVKCTNCGKRHVDIMCYGKNEHSNIEKPELKEVTDENTTLSNNSCSKEVYLQTLIVYIKEKNLKHLIRVIIDMGSQRSYISKFTARKMKLKGLGVESVNHGLFGGIQHTETHQRYRINLMNVDGSYNLALEVLDEKKICASLPKFKDDRCLIELKGMGITISDVEIKERSFLYENDPNEIHLLIGADYAGKLLTGNMKHLSGSLVAVQTHLGWTVIGRTSSSSSDSTDSIVNSMLVKDVPLTHLWDLDVIGIKDSAEHKGRKEQDAAAYEHFKKTLKILPDGRYEVSLPWLEGHQPLMNNRISAERRLKSTVKVLKSQNLLQNYEDVFREWLEEEIIEEVDSFRLEDSNCFYLPHRAVVKEHSTTKIRPVFDASARQKNYPSLNDCLEKGPNLVELIPNILNRFRLKKYGVTADIKKAFLQISVSEKDRDYLRFLWFKGGDPEKLKIYRHKRVVFGVNASPFLLGAAISYLLDNAPDDLQETARKLKKSMYVDNCVTSLDSEEELENFIRQSKQIMSTAQFDLRGWRYNGTRSGGCEADDKIQSEENISVLGLQWNINEDTLCCAPKDYIATPNLPITKRSILSSANQIFDPLGLFSPITLIPKVLMQDCWRAKLSWDSELPVEISKKYLKWKRDLEKIKELTIPRRLTCNDGDGKSSYHVFCDASQKAYSTCIYLRNEDSSGVTCRLVQARSRVAPLKSVTISRLELLACTIGVRLMNSIKEDLEIEKEIPVFYWSDSMNALHWIRNDEQWGVFVMNRVTEIRKYTKPEEWNHISGTLNPADLPSRGCSVEVLLSQDWYGGPSWLKQERKYWPSTEIIPDKSIVNSEKRKTIISVLTVPTEEFPYLTRISDFEKIVRVTAWIRRFIKNCKVTEASRNYENLEAQELKEAELNIWKIVQRSTFKSVKDERLRHLSPFIDPSGIIRTKTRLLMREDLEDFKCPIILPPEHSVVISLIMHKHKLSSHCGIQTLMSILREDFWILHTRRTIRKVLRNCIICKRFNTKHPEVHAAPLPEDRVKDASVFEVTGIDLAGPLFLRDGTKAWVVLFTCAVYRAIHLELVSALSTDKFLMSLRRFISRRGRPSIIYTDNGSNFKGSNLALKNIDWERIVKDTSIKRITWKFIPPGSPWWGGFWERMIGLTKNILRKILGKASLRFEELTTVLCDCENVINSRPLTYVSEELELEPLTPAIFLRDIKESGVPDLDHIDAKRLRKRVLYRIKICQDLRKRFRSEYLGQLKNHYKKLKNCHNFSVGDIVLLKSSDQRINWPLAKISEIYPGKDGVVRVVQLKTKYGTLLRPVQKVYPLELNILMDDELRKAVSTENGLTEQDSDCASSTVSKYGRQIRAPKRLDLLNSSHLV